jgi:sensor histidine kinase YesM
MLFIEKKFDGIVSSKTGDSINDAKLLKLSVNKDMKGIGLSNIKESLTATIGRHNKWELIERVPYPT